MAEQTNSDTEFENVVYDDLQEIVKITESTSEDSGVSNSLVCLPVFLVFAYFHELISTLFDEDEEYSDVLGDLYD